MVDLIDAKALLARAERHYSELEGLVGPSQIWSISTARDGETGEWVYAIEVAKQRLVEAGPVVADCANNISSALDHVAAAIARSQGHDDLDGLYFPWSFKDVDFKGRLKGTEKYLGTAMATAIAEAREKHQHEVHHVEAAKRISNKGKHWKLKATREAIHALTHIGRDFKQVDFPIPADAFEASDRYEFHRALDGLPPARGWQTLIGLKIEGLGDEMPVSPTSIFPCAFRYVRGTIEEVEKAAAP